jgi:ferrous iron transport protein A
MPLGLLLAEEHAEIMEVKSRRKFAAGCTSSERAIRSCQNREGMGLRVGKVVEVLSNQGQGPLLLEVDESRIAMGRGMAMKIVVQRIEV